MKDIGAKREALNQIHRLRNEAKRAIDERSIDEFERCIAEINVISGRLITTISWEREE